MLQQYDPRNRDILVWINGTLAHRDEARVSVFDSAVQNGDAVWEGLRLYDGRIFRLREHLARLRKGAERLAYAAIPSDADIADAVRRTLEANAMRDGVHVRLTLSRGMKYTSGMDPRLNAPPCTLIIVAEHKPPVYNRAGVRLITASVSRPGPEILDQHIHSCNQLTSILAKMEANAAGADDAILLDSRGFLAETNATHLFLVTRGVVRTPTTIACPEGITRAAVLELCARNAIASREEDIPPADIARAEEMFCTGTMGELTPVIGVDGRTIGAGAPGPVTTRLIGLFAAMVKNEGERLVD